MFGTQGPEVRILSLRPFFFAFANQHSAPPVHRQEILCNSPTYLFLTSHSTTRGRVMWHVIEWLFDHTWAFLLGAINKTLRRWTWLSLQATWIVSRSKRVRAHITGTYYNAVLGRAAERIKAGKISPTQVEAIEEWTNKLTPRVLRYLEEAKATPPRKPPSRVERWFLSQG